MKNKAEIFAAIVFGTPCIACALICIIQLGPHIVHSSYGNNHDFQTAMFIATLTIIAPATVGGGLLGYAINKLK